MLATLLIYSGVTPVGKVNAFPTCLYGMLTNGSVAPFIFCYHAKTRLYMANVILSKESSSTELKCYFEAVLKLAQSANEFPINLDDVWMLAYTNKAHAVRSLKKNFIEGIDYYLTQNGKVAQILLTQNGKQDSKGKWGGNNEITYMLSTSCLEYFIARKVRPVFEVYRQVFHKVATTKILPSPKEKELKRLLNKEKKTARQYLNELIREQAKREAAEFKAMQQERMLEHIAELHANALVKIFKYDSFLTSIGQKGRFEGLPY